jgi:hypothetical protein
VIPSPRPRSQSVAAIAFALLVVAGCGLATTQPETYTLEPAGVVTARDPDKLVYRVQGRAGELAVDKFVGPGAADGDVLYTVEGHPGLAFTAYAIGPSCWVIRGEAHIDGEFIKTLSTSSGTTPNIYVRVPKSPIFAVPDTLPPDDPNRVIGNSVCVDADGKAVLAQ